MRNSHTHTNDYADESPRVYQMPTIFAAATASPVTATAANATHLNGIYQMDCIHFTHKSSNYAHLECFFRDVLVPRCVPEKCNARRLLAHIHTRRETKKRTKCTQQIICDDGLLSVCESKWIYRVEEISTRTQHDLSVLWQRIHSEWDEQDDYD